MASPNGPYSRTISAGRTAVITGGASVTVRHIFTKLGQYEPSVTAEDARAFDDSFAGDMPDDIEDVFDEPQVKVSKHLAYLRERGMVVAEREQNWMIYSLPEKRDAELEANLRCLQQCVQSDPIFNRDLRMLAKVRAKRDAPAGALLAWQP